MCPRVSVPAMALEWCPAQELASRGTHPAMPPLLDKGHRGKRNKSPET